MKLLSIVTALAATFRVASAATYVVAVGENGSLTYNPPSIDNATVGDVIAFQFKAKNHTVTQSTFAAPCTSSGVDSGFFPVTAGADTIPQWSFTINNASAPLWFYCRQTGHCAQGMVFAINPTATKSFSAFQAAANATASNSSTSTTAGSGSSSTPSASVVDPTSTAGATSGAMSTFGISTVGLLSAVGMVSFIAL